MVELLLHKNTCIVYIVTMETPSYLAKYPSYSVNISKESARLEEGIFNW